MSSKFRAKVRNFITFDSLKLKGICVAVPPLSDDQAEDQILFELSVDITKPVNPPVINNIYKISKKGFLRKHINGESKYMRIYLSTRI